MDSHFALFFSSIGCHIKVKLGNGKCYGVLPY